MSKVSSMAAEARQSLVGAAGELDVSRWRGTAADGFRQDIGALPTQLTDVVVSYEEASAALSAYRLALQSAQREAGGVRAAAMQAAADASQASAQQSQAQQTAAGLQSQLSSAVYRRNVLRTQLAAATDPATHTTLQSSVNTAQSGVMRFEADLQSAQAAHDRHAGDAAEARDRLARSLGQAESIRSQVGAAVATAAALLARAERDAHLPNMVQRTVSELRETIVEYGPVLADTLQLGASLFMLAAMFLPLGAPVFMACALICTGGSLLATLAVDSLSPGGLTTDRLLDLGVKTLTLIAMALVPEAGMLAKGAGWAATGASTLQEYKQHGPDGLAFALGGMVLGTAGSKFGGAIAGKVLGSAKKNPTVRRLLRDVSKDIANSHTKVLSVPVVSHSPYVQSLYGVGSVKGGQFLNGTVTKPSSQAHALSSAALATQLGESAGAATDSITDWVKTKLLKPNTDVQIDINLPMRGSEAQQPGGAGGLRR